MAKLEEEFKAPPQLAVAPEDHSPGAEIFRKVIRNPIRAAQTLAGPENWRKGPAELAAAVLPDAPGNGFALSAATLTAGEWKELHAELVRLAAK